MVERPTKLMHEGKMVDAVDVPILDSSEKWCEYTLEDGTVIRAKTSLVTAIRLVDEYDPEGNPVYNLNISGTVALAYVNPDLKKKSD